MWWADSVDGVLTAFNLLIRRLEKIALHQHSRSAVLGEQLHKIAEEKGAVQQEAARAERVAAKLKELLA